MGKNGPCHHCGVTSTPLWRNGPPEKPILCNACGSRWRTKGSLANYTPLHAREPIKLEEPKVVKMKSLCFKTKEQKNRKDVNVIVESECEMPFSEANHNSIRVLERDASNRSSSGSAVSYTESCADFGSMDASDWTGSAQSKAWDPLVPSKKRNLNHPKFSPFEKLTKDLYSIWYEQQSSNLSGLSDEDLLFEGETPSSSVEFGHGGMLLRYPCSKAVEEESEASSLPLDNKLSNEASFPVNSESKRTLPCVEKLKSQDHAKRHRLSRNNLNMLRDKDSLLRFTDLRDVVSLEVFMKHMTQEEQQLLMRYLPSIDIVAPPDSLNSLFSSPQIMENLSSFQQLLQEGIFDLSFCQMNLEECRTLKSLVLLNLTKSRWVELYRQLKDAKQKQVNGPNKERSGTNFLRHANLTPLKRPHEAQNQQLKEYKGTMRSPKIVCGSSSTSLPSTKSSMPNTNKSGSKEMLDTDDFVDSELTCISPRSLFAFPPDRTSMLGFTEDNSDQDLLLNVQCSASFPEAELLYHHPWNQKTLSNNSHAENAVIAEEGSLCNFPDSNFNSVVSS